MSKNVLLRQQNPFLYAVLNGCVKSEVDDFVFRKAFFELVHGKNGYATATGTTDKIFVAATKNFATTTKRFVDRTKHFVVVTKCFCYPYFKT